MPYIIKVDETSLEPKSYRSKRKKQKQEERVLYYPERYQPDLVFGSNALELTRRLCRRFFGRH